MFECGFGKLVPALLPDDCSEAANALLEADEESLRYSALLLAPHLLTDEKMTDIAVHIVKKYLAESVSTAVFIVRSITSTNAMHVLRKLDDQTFAELREKLDDEEPNTAITLCAGMIVRDELQHFMFRSGWDYPVGCFNGYVAPVYGYSVPPTRAAVDWSFEDIDLKPLFLPAQALVYMHRKILVALEGEDTVELPLGSRIAMYVLCGQVAAIAALPKDIKINPEGLELDDPDEVRWRLCVCVCVCVCASWRLGIGGGIGVT